MIIFIIVITCVNVWCFCLYLVLWTKRHVHACTDVHVRRAEPCMLLKTLFFFFIILILLWTVKSFNIFMKYSSSPWTMKQGWSLVQDYKYLLILLVWWKKSRFSICEVYSSFASKNSIHKIKDFENFCWCKFCVWSFALILYSLSTLQLCSLCNFSVSHRTINKHCLIRVSVQEME